MIDAREADGFMGELIDENLAKKVGSGRSGARHQTGIMEFMAMEVFRCVSHTYWHDLESFCVLLLIWLRRAWERGFRCKIRDRPKGSMLKKWYMGSYEDIA